jgi:hypothetical protein
MGAADNQISARMDVRGKATDIERFLTQNLREFCATSVSTYRHCATNQYWEDARKSLISLTPVLLSQATNQGVVGSNPASRTNKIKDLRQKWRESFFYWRDFSWCPQASTPCLGFQCGDLGI